jgi:hypothetical protein
VPRVPASPARPRALALLLALAIPLAVPPAGRSQDLVGCQLVEGTLQCVPGLTANPQQQIRILEGQINRDQALEGAVEQGIAGLRQLVLRGEAREGKLLQAGLDADAVAGLPATAYHWYRRPPGRMAWELIAGASGPSYTLRPGDVAYQVMVVVAVPSDGGSQRSASAPLGPVKAAAAAP